MNRIHPRAGPKSARPTKPSSSIEGAPMNMSPESMSKVLSQFLLPFGQQWAASNGYPMLSKLLADEALQDLITRYGDSMLAAYTEARAAAARSAPKADAVNASLEL